MRYIGNGQTLSRFEAWRNMAMMLGHWQLRGYGMWAVEERSQWCNDWSNRLLATGGLAWI
jgi:hypothetical protein